MLWSDVKDWDPGNLESLAEDLRGTRDKAASYLDDVDAAEGRVVSTTSQSTMMALWTSTTFRLRHRTERSKPKKPTQ